MRRRGPLIGGKIIKKSSLFATCTYSLKIRRTSNMGTTYTRLRRLDLKRQKIEKIAKRRKLKKIANRIKVSPLRPKQRESRS